MSMKEIYDALQKIVEAAENCDMKAVNKIDDHFQKLLYDAFKHKLNWSMDPDVILYDSCANSACYSL